MAATLVIKWSMAQVTNCSRPIQPRESACGNQACQTWACKKLTTGDESFLEVVSVHHAKKELLLLIQVEDPHGEATAAKLPRSPTRVNFCTIRALRASNSFLWQPSNPHNPRRNTPWLSGGKLPFLNKRRSWCCPWMSPQIFISSSNRRSGRRRPA